MSMITATAWVPRGYPKQMPTRAAFDQDEFDRIQDLANMQLEDAQQDLEEARKESDGGVSLDRTNGEVDDDLKEYDLEHYDDDEDDDSNEDDATNGDDTDKAESNNGIFGNVKNLVYHNNNEEDPYITLHGDDAESDDEREELQILPTDNVLVAGRVEDEVAHLEFYVYEDEADNLYVHHDVMLPAIPLCVEWLNAAVRKTKGAELSQSNYIVVGTMDQDIEIWDLDVVDSMYPDIILGAGGDPTLVDGEKPVKKKKKKRSPKPTNTHHTASVLALAANPNHTNLLASASADTTIKLWDLSSETPSVAAASFDYHNDKVCSLDWHPTQATILLSGSYDRTVIAADMVNTDEGGLGRRKWTVDSDVEAVKWDPHDSNCFFVTTEGGVVYYFDARSTTTEKKSELSKPIWRLQAHDGSVSAFGINSRVPGFVATGSSDKVVKLWNVPIGTADQTNGTTTRPSGPALIASRSVPDTGRVFSTSFAPDPETAFRLAIAGSKGNVTIWDTSTNKAVRSTFAGKVPATVLNGDVSDVKDRMTALTVDESSSDDEGDDDAGDGEDDDMDGA